MLVLRIRCVDDGRELLLERYGADEHSIQVVEFKKFVLQQRQQQLGCMKNNDQQPLVLPSSLEDCFVVFRGHILADADMVDLNALNPSDFFVFVPDRSQSVRHWSSHSEVEGDDDADLETFNLLRSQLLDMGFSAEVATQALQRSGNNLVEAIACIAEGTSQEVATTPKSRASKAPLGNVLHQDLLTKLRDVVAVDSFEAVLLLQQVPSEVLHQLNENPVETLRWLSQPAPIPRTTSMTFDDTEAIADEEKDTKSVHVTSDSSNAVVDRLVGMGFERDLVNAMYESCGGDEQLTANALLQTLES
ncbi:hypothetical protein PsorP6_007925 [Peronosclerospora sorghi]|uniref:Uncharacterized protein n=1 Tax=Peronosclerospora sorghi TaxID=230839 RepID=A0ACC0W8Q9_9STRA|nr:hypothetical protein PsorP6_007925 [Peronosclerospora sorghi]